MIGTLTGEKLRECMSKIKALRLRLSDEEMVQIANLLPASEVEMYLVRQLFCESLRFYYNNIANFRLSPMLPNV